MDWAVDDADRRRCRLRLSESVGLVFGGTVIMITGTELDTVVTLFIRRRDARQLRRPPAPLQPRLPAPAGVLTVPVDVWVSGTRADGNKLSFTDLAPPS